MSEMDGGEVKKKHIILHKLEAIQFIRFVNLSDFIMWNAKSGEKNGSTDSNGGKKRDEITENRENILCEYY